MKNIFVCVLFLICGSLGFSEEGTDSLLYADAAIDSTPKDPMSDEQSESFKIHDLIQIVVMDSSKAKSKADSKTDRETKIEAEIANWIKFRQTGAGHNTLGAAGTSTVKPSIDLDSKYESDNSAETGRTFSISFTITAEVVDIRPNGNLVLEAKKERTVNEETESVTLTGEVAQNSIKNSVVSSDKLAKLKVTLTGEGEVNDGRKRGFLSKVLGFLWPF